MSDQRLSVERLQELRSALTVELRVEAELDARSAGLPAGASDYHRTVTARWFRDGPLRVVDADTELLLQTAADSRIDPAAEVVELPVGRVHIVVVDYFEPSVYDALDAREADLEQIGSTLFLPGRIDPASGTALQPDFAEALEPSGSYGLIINSVEIDSRFRGARFGLVAVAAAIGELRRGCAFAVLYPMSPGLRDERARKRSRERLQGYWAQLGFELWRDGVMWLSLAHVTFDRAVTELLDEF